jgi:hypothetical protein
MEEHILFVFEGERSEKKIIDAIQQHQLLLPAGKVRINSCFCADIHQLCAELEQDEFLDLFSLLKEKKGNERALGSFTSNDFSSIYLFFDYDPQAALTKDGELDSDKLDQFNERIKKLIDYFNQETENGKIFISYPMLEAIKYSEMCCNLECFLNHKVSHSVSFKKHMNALCESQECYYNNIKTYNMEIWKKIFELHCIKANYITSDSKEFPNDIMEIEQNKIFEKICNLKQVPVLSSIPLMVANYYGIIAFKELLR